MNSPNTSVKTKEKRQDKTTQDPIVAILYGYSFSAVVILLIIFFSSI